MHDKALEIASALLLVAGVIIGTAAAKGMPSRLWSNLDHVLVRCPAASADEVALAGLCDAILDEMHHLSPYPVDRFNDDSPAGHSPRSLLVDVRLFRQDGLQHLQLSVRRAASIDDSEGTRTLPAVALAEPASSESVRTVVIEALARALPWRRDASRPSAKKIAERSSSF
ncbi:hypothetical protein [Sphingomonas solaris]|uniref:Uncharacterized protein n=1 Tax=Alterirhizorhabdus solaris TaxID=2529389 RepID=A0A558R2M9_9SPHN|nr:hypothetical protein [Sphingomonas solaris]TVV73592.1 hypothetical protein FOY91_11900 [Sphingomonas solaris]